MRAFFGLPRGCSRVIKELDLRMLLAEANAMYGKEVTKNWECVQGLEPAIVNLAFWGPEFAGLKFYKRYLELTDGK
jgi:hypothetical protein